MADSPFPSVPSVDDMLSTINATVDGFKTDPESLQALVNPHPSGNPILLGRRIPEPEKLAALQVKGVEDNAQKWYENTLTPKKNFKEEALRPTAVARYKDSMRKVIDEDRHAAGMRNVKEDEALDTVRELGASHYSAAVRARQSKILRVAQEMDSSRLALAKTIDAMPVSTEAEREAKMLANKRGQQALGRQRRGKGG